MAVSLLGWVRQMYSEGDLLQVHQRLQVLYLANAVLAQEKRADAAHSLQVLDFPDLVGAQFEHLQLGQVQVLNLRVGMGTFLILLLRRKSLRSCLRWLRFSIFLMLL
jgi:hypothetical protein